MEAEADNYLGRVTKARIPQAVAEAKGQRAADRIERLKKGDMAQEAESLLADTAWLPEPLRVPGKTSPAASKAEATPTGEQTPADGGETAMAECITSNDNDAARDAPADVAAQ